jgi:hypothetical protein
MKNKVFLTLILISLLLAACAPAENSATAERPPYVQPLDVPTAEEESVALGSVSDYIDEYYSKGTYCADAITRIYSLINQAEDDIKILVDENWIKEKNDTFKIIGGTCMQLGWDAGIPNGYEETNALLLETRSYFSDFVETFWDAISEENLGKMQQARENLFEASELFAQAGAAMPE